MLDTLAVIVNKNSGASSLPEKFAALKAACAMHDLVPEIHLVSNGEEATHEARAAVARGIKLIVAAGGDGTLSAVASGLLGTDVRLGILPLGTFNHFAADLGIPPDIAGALLVLKDGMPTKVDVGEVNKIIFLNNSSIGIYPRLVHERETEQRKNGTRKTIALFRAFWRVMKKYPSLAIKIKIGSKEMTRKTAFVFVGNNEYILEGLRMGRREGITRGYLDIGVAHGTARKDLIRIFAKAIFGRLMDGAYFDEYRVHEARIDSRKRFLPVSLDGEVKVLRTPLRYRILPKALTVMLPILPLPRPV